MSSYRVTVTAGAHFWDVTSGDDPDYGLADPVKITRSLPDVDLFPAQPDPAQASFAVVVPDAADLADLDEGAVVAIHIYAPHDASAPLESFHGRVSDMDASPHPLGCLYTVTCVDYLGDLIEEDVTLDVGYFLVQNIIDDLFAQLGLTAAYSAGPPAYPIGLPFSDTYLDYTAAVDGTFPALLERVLRQWITANEPRRVFVTLTDGDATITGDPGTFDVSDVGKPIFGNVGGWIPPGTTIVAVTSSSSAEMSAPATGDYATFGANIGVSEWDNAYRLVLDQNITADALDPVTPYVLRPMLRATTIDPTSTPDPLEVLVIDGDYVGSDVSYTLNKRQGVRRVRVKYAGGRWDSTYGGLPATTAKIDSDLTDSGDAQLVGDFYLPANAARSRWVLDTFTWRLDKDPAGDYLPQLGTPVAIAPVATAWNPLGYPWFTGRLVKYTLTVSGGRHTADVTLRDIAT